MRRTRRSAAAEVIRQDDDDVRLADDHRGAKLGHSGSMVAAGFDVAFAISRRGAGMLPMKNPGMKTGAS